MYTSLVVSSASDGVAELPKVVEQPSINSTRHLDGESAMAIDVELLKP
jgi:hypothetical protein